MTLLYGSYWLELLDLKFLKSKKNLKLSNLTTNSWQ